MREFHVTCIAKNHTLYECRGHDQEVLNIGDVIVQVGFGVHDSEEAFSLEMRPDESKVFELGATYKLSIEKLVAQ